MDVIAHATIDDLSTGWRMRPTRAVSLRPADSSTAEDVGRQSISGDP
jgi:hypothetical protein